MKSFKRTEAANKQTKAPSNWKKIVMKPHWDFGLAFIFLSASALLAYFIYKFNILAFDIFLMIVFALLILNLILFLTIFYKKMPNWSIWLRRIFMVSLCGALAYGSFTLDNIYGALEAITQPETATSVNVSLITLKEGGAHTLKELSGKKIGIQNASDASNSAYVKKELEKESELVNVSYEESLDYASLYDSLSSGEIDALIITDYYFKTILKDTYPTIEDDIFLLKSYQKEKESNFTTSTKDIRYEPFTVYIAGVDEGEDPSIDARSDVNIILMVNPLANHIEMVSIPRDSFVPNPALNNGNDKLTHLGLNGVDNSMKGLEQVFGIPIDYYVKLNFFSVISIIDAIGQIEVDVPVSFCEQDEYRSFAEEDLICLNEGVQKVNGKQALAFARHRKSYTDVMRGKAQQEVIRGIINVLTTPSGAANINQVMKIAPSSVSTNMPLQQVTNFISLQLENLKPWTIESIVLENGSDASLLTASMPSTPLSVLLLNQFDVTSVFDAYQEMLNQMQFASFNFDLNNLNRDKIEMPKSNANILWAGMNTSQYTPNETPPITEEKAPVETPATPTVPEKTPSKTPTKQPTTPNPDNTDKNPTTKPTTKPTQPGTDEDDKNSNNSGNSGSNNGASGGTNNGTSGGTSGGTNNGTNNGTSGDKNTTKK